MSIENYRIFVNKNIQKFTNLQIFKYRLSSSTYVIRKIPYSTSVPGKNIYTFEMLSAYISIFLHLVPIFQTAHILIWTFGLWEEAKESFSFTESGSFPMK